MRAWQAITTSRLGELEGRVDELAAVASRPPPPPRPTAEVDHGARSVGGRREHRDGSRPSGVPHLGLRAGTVPRVTRFSGSTATGRRLPESRYVHRTPRPPARRPPLDVRGTRAGDRRQHERRAQLRAAARGGVVVLGSRRNRRAARDADGRHVLHAVRLRAARAGAHPPVPRTIAVVDGVVPGAVRRRLAPGGILALPPLRDRARQRRSDRGGCVAPIPRRFERREGSGRPPGRRHDARAAAADRGRRLVPARHGVPPRHRRHQERHDLARHERERPGRPR